MSDINQTNYPNWTDDQWAMLSQDRLRRSAKRPASLIAQFLSLYGPVDSSVVAGSQLSIGPQRGATRARLGTTPGALGHRQRAQRVLSHDLPSSSLSPRTRSPNPSCSPPRARSGAPRLPWRASRMLSFSTRPTWSGPATSFADACRVDGWQKMPQIFTVTNGSRCRGARARGGDPRAPLRRPRTSRLASLCPSWGSCPLRRDPAANAAVGRGVGEVHQRRRR